MFVRDCTCRALATAALVAAIALPACGVPTRDRAGWTEPTPGLFVTGPYLMVGPPGTAYVVLKADLPEAPEVDWWPDRDSQMTARVTQVGEPTPGAEVTTVAAFQSLDLWIAVLTDLPSDARIAYRVRSTLGTTGVLTFRIGRAEGEPFRFAAYGDTRTGHGVHRAVVEAMAREHIDFALHTGDMVERGGVESQWDRFFQIERPLLVSTPIIPTIGNHDIGAREYFRHYFLHRLWAKNRRYFVKDWGELRIVALDGGIECRDGCAQYSFADQALEEGARQGKLMLIMLHYPPYSSGKHGSNKNVQKPISDLARKHGVELVIAGHDHNYERTKVLDGTTYIVSGSAGAPIRPVSPRSFTATVRTEPHYVLIDVEDGRMILRAVNLAGDTFDSFVVRPNPPQGK